MTCQFCQLQQLLQVGVRDNGIIFHAQSTVRRHEHQRAEIDLDQSAERASTALNRLPMLWTLRLGTKSKKTENDRRTNPVQLSVRSQQRDSGASKPCELAIECDQPVTPSLSRLIGNDAVGEITTLFEEA